MRRRHVCQKDVCQKEKMGGEGEDRLHSSSPAGLFTKSATTIARTLASKKVSPKGPGSGMRMLTYFINRAGHGLSAERRTELEEAKSLLSKRVERERKAQKRKAAA